MIDVSTIAKIGQLVREYRNGGKQIGFVPTMGALHEGHLTLIRRAKSENDICISSVFVNPTQFNNKDDLARYPRDLERDARLLGENGCDVLFAPEVSEMYPGGEDDLLTIDFGDLDKVMEGRFRPGHFRGVATIVHKLFDSVTPHTAYFGKKDYQQLAIIRALTGRMQLPVQIIACETVREPDGLAMSSRNVRLTSSCRSHAPVIYSTLCMVREKAGTCPVSELENSAIRQIGSSGHLRVEYFTIGHKDTLQPLTDWTDQHAAVAFTAVFAEDVRLIDNLELF